MTAKALGMIEAIGLAAAIEAADAAAKAANVTVLGYENARGGGRITVKLVGDVGAVRAAISAGSAAAMRVGKVAGCLVIPRPHDEIEALIARIDRGRAPAATTLVPLTPAPVALAPEPEAVTPEPDSTVAAPSDLTPVEAKPLAQPVAVTPEPAPAGEAEARPLPFDAPQPEAEPLAQPEAEQRRPAPVKRGKARKSEPPTTREPGEVEG